MAGTWSQFDDGRLSTPEQYAINWRQKCKNPALSKQPPPERFSGDPLKAQSFLVQVELHFTCRPNTFPDAQSKVAFVLSYLSGDAATWAIPLVHKNSPLLYNWRNSVCEFERVFDRRTVTQSADHELLDLRQGNQDLLSYLANFNRLAAETSWPEEKQPVLFYKGLKEELKDILAQIDPQPTDCQELINLVLRLDHRLAERKGTRKKIEKYSWRVHDNRDSRTPKERTPEPMEIGTIRRPLTKDEKDLRRKNIQCLYCGRKVLTHPDANQPFIVEADASDVAIGAVLSQRNKDTGQLHPVAYISRKLNKTKQNYVIAEKELLAIRDAFKEWRHHLLGAKYTVTVYTDHRNLQFMSSARLLTPRQLRWMLFFAEFDFVVTFRPGKDNRKADALSRQESTTLPAFQASRAIIAPDKVLCIIKTEDFFEEIRNSFTVEKWQTWAQADPKRSIKQGLPFHDARLFVPTTKLRKIVFH
ncbi:hypothetical protein NDU88_002482 [Pleurodeles waltl]|uniref:Reverse transcriptase RNase H-like domain-containing protein n=1 Tax=Pleurodeles waltl TaxID=8319 RepID=A0AAV7MPI2_PLEWA|nr:hypothetical protein NDU88_002482 [Pleurodeles waltl]